MTTVEAFAEARQIEMGLRSLRARMWRECVDRTGFVAGDVPENIAALDRSIESVAALADAFREKADATIEKLTRMRRPANAALASPKVVRRRTLAGDSLASLPDPLVITSDDGHITIY